MAITFGAIGKQHVTFASDDAEEGQVCKMSANGTVTVCEEDDGFIGVVESIRGGFASVVLEGYVELPYSGTAPDLGYAILASDGDGKVAEAEEGRTCLVVSIDSTNHILGLFL